MQSGLRIYSILAIIYSLEATAIIWIIALLLKVKRISRWLKILIVDAIIVATCIFLLLPLPIATAFGYASSQWFLYLVRFYTFEMWIRERLYCAIILVALTWLIAFIRYTAKGFIEWLKT